MGDLDLTGMRFGRLTVISYSHSENGKNMWNCLCDCGNIRKIRTADLRNGNSRSCGCKRTETIKTVCTKHGLAHSKIYAVWCAMQQRCCNENDLDFPNYGGRGIKVHEEWKTSFQAFYDYVSQLPHFGENGYSLDRINNNGNYEPGNVRWATAKEQANNRRKRKCKK